MRPDYMYARKSVADRIADRVEMDTNGGCWLWGGTVGKHGYGVISIKMKQYRAHRLSYETYKGPIPEGLGVLHKCDVRCCVNPEHLFLGDAGDNARDMVKKGRASPRKGELSATAKLTVEQVQEIRLSSDSSFVLAERHNTTAKNINQIRRRTTWRHI